MEKEGSSSSGVDAEHSGVRRQQLLQIGGCAGENKTGKWGGGGSARCHVEEGKRERERAPSATVGSADRGIKMASGGTVEGSNAHSRRRQAGE
jgi:hypothetical protein